MNLDPHVAPYATIFASAGAQHGVDPLLLAAICARESGGGIYLRPRGPGGKGDNGHGHGLMQIDDRSHGDWLQRNEWFRPEPNILEGARIFREALDFFHSRGFTGETAEHLAACAYNAGAGHVERQIAKAGKGGDAIAYANMVTTGGNYGYDVIRRRASYRGHA